MTSPIKSPADQFARSFGVFGQAVEYLVDAGQRSVLFWDVMRQRGQQYQEHLEQAVPNVLNYQPELVMDGRTLTLNVFRQRGNQGGGDSIQRQVTEGKGNGNGILEPGEEATIWVKMVQGMDPFDKNNWHRCKIYSDSPWVTEIADIQEEKQREWTGAQERTSLIRLPLETPAGTTIPLILSNESWSFDYTPDVRYGSQNLYQAFQFHREHLHRFELRVP